MMSVMVRLLQLVTKLKYLPVASRSLCLLLSQTVDVPNSDILQVENKTNPSYNPPSPTGPRSACDTVKICLQLHEKANRLNHKLMCDPFLATLTKMLGCGQPQG